MKINQDDNISKYEREKIKPEELFYINAFLDIRKRSLSDDQISKLVTAFQHLESIKMDPQRKCISNRNLFGDILKGLKTDQVSKVSVDYTGIHLGEYQKSTFLRLIDSFENGETLHEFYVLKVIKDAKELLKKMPNMRTCQLKNEHDNLIIFGDLHGNFRDLKHIIDLYGIPGDKYQFLFNGDFVDRGEQQIEVLITILYSFLLYPERVFFNRGNHEDYEINKDENFHPSFEYELAQKYVYSENVFNEAENLFSYIPLATIIENKANLKIFVVHGGISSKVDLRFVKEINRNDFLTINSGRNLRLSGDKAKAADVLSDMLWSDPIQFPLQSYVSKMGIQATGEQFNVFRNLGTLFGYDVTNKFLSKNGFDFMIRSHEVREHGFSVDHDKCFTLFSASGYGRYMNNGSILLLEYNAQMFTRYEYVTKRKNTSENLNEIRNNLRSFKQLFEDDKRDFLLKFVKLDKKNTGTINIQKWAKAVKEIIEEIESSHLINLKDYLGVYYESNQTINYNSLFQSSDASKEQQNFIYQDIFKVIDLDKNDILSSSEVKKAFESIKSQNPQLKKITESLARKFEQFLKSMDFDNNNKIDVNEFKEFLCLPNSFE